MSAAYGAPGTSAAPPQRARSRRGAGLALLLVAGLLIGTTGVSFLATAGSVDLSSFSTIVKPQDRANGLPSGKRAEITKLAGTFPITQGHPTQAEGVQMFRVKVAELQSDAVSLHYAWQNAQDANAVLKNPNSYIQVTVYYESAAACTGKILGVAAVSGTADVCPDTAATATAMITPRNAVADLRPKVAGKQYLWVLATVFVPGGAPPGQQSNLSSLRFSLDARSN